MPARTAHSRVALGRPPHLKTLMTIVLPGAAALAACSSQPVAEVRGVLPAPARAAQSGYAPVNGLSLYYEVHGDAGGTPLVLLHGGGSTIETSFGRLLPELVRTRRVIAFEQQGHGHTADVERPFSFEQSAEDTAALLAWLGVPRADVFGYSNGGNIALELGLRHPELVRKLVVASAMFRRDGLEDAFWDSMRKARLEDMPADLKAAYLGVAPRPGDLQRFHDKCVARMLAFQDLPAESMRALAAETLVVVGDRDIVRPEHAVELFRLLPHAHLSVLPDTDHAAVTERVAELVPALEAFLGAP